MYVPTIIKIESFNNICEQNCSYISNSIGGNSIANQPMFNRFRRQMMWKIYHRTPYATTDFSVKPGCKLSFNRQANGMRLLLRTVNTTSKEGKGGRGKGYKATESEWAMSIELRGEVTSGDETIRPRGRGVRGHGRPVTWTTRGGEQGCQIWLFGNQIYQIWLFWVAFGYLVKKINL